jgi:hypothetical protein
LFSFVSPVDSKKHIYIYKGPLSNITVFVGPRSSRPTWGFFHSCSTFH